MHGVIVHVTIHDQEAVESEDAARAIVDRMQAPGEFVTFDNVHVGQVVAHA